MTKKLLLLLYSVLLMNNAYAQEDCSSAIAICNKSPFSYTALGLGDEVELLGGCLLLSGENHSVWYKFTIATSGTLTFDINPTGLIDYDWAIYGPDVNCSNRGNPIRCNASGYLGNTGMNMTNTNFSSLPGNTSPYCQYMDVIAGQTYYLYINNWSPPVNTFNLTWGGTATFVSPFTSPAISPNPFILPGNPGMTINSPREIPICNPSVSFDFNTLSSGIINGNPNFSISYFININDAYANSNPIVSPFIVNNYTIYYYSINYSDPSDPNNTLSSCRQIGSFIFKDNSTPAIINASNTVLCPNGSITLSSNNATGNTWSTGATTQTITVTSPGTYTLTSTNGTCTSPAASVTITQSTDPNLQVTGNLILCGNPSTTLTATSAGTGNTYIWSTGATTPAINVSAPGTYSVTVKTPANCQYTKTVTVTQGTVPAVQNASLGICTPSATALFDLTSAQTNISTSPGSTFSYYLNQSDALAQNTNTINTPTTYISGNATLYVLVKSGNCSAIAQLQLIVVTKPVASITASSNIICNNNPVTLTSNSATGNTWSTGATTPSITVSAPGIYTLTQSNGTCMGDPVSVTITKGTDPNVQITGTLNFCQGSTTVLTAVANGAGNSFLWSNGSATASTTVNASGTYTVTVTTPDGCQYTQSATATMDPAITVNISTPGQIDCSHSQVTLDATSSVYSSGATFLWTASGGGNIVSGANTLTPVVNNSGTYTLTITSPTPNGCVQQGSATVIKNVSPPVIHVSASQLKICKGESVTLTATGAGTYTWTNLTGTGNTQTVSPGSTTTYTVTGIGTNGCNATSSATVTITVVPEISSSLNNIEICKGDKGILDAGAGTNYTYNWNTGATSQTINVNTAGTYTVNIGNGTCTKAFTATVSYIVTPQIKEIIYNKDLLTIIVQNGASAMLEYSIDNGVTWQASNIFNVLKNTRYSIRVRNRGASCDTLLEYYTFFMANVITPNNDGKNDVVDFSEISKYGKFEGSIFDRYGKDIFKINVKNPVWNGTYIGRPLPTGTYWYQLHWEDLITKRPVQLSGWILLKNRD